MRGLIPLAAFLFISQLNFAQLTVTPSHNGKNDHYLYVKNQVLFVQNEIRLMKNPTTGIEPSIYLRGEAQLLQGEGQTSKNSGTGGISIYREGTVNAYDYNYWGSPVTSPETGLFGISLLHAPFSEIFSKPAQHTQALNGLANPLTISSHWIYTFNGTGYSNWSFIGTNTAVPPGYGFTMKGTDGKDATIVDETANNPGNSQRYDFRGKPNSGNIEIPVTAENFVLVGNPYPSALDLSLFLLENSGDGTLKTGCYGDLDRRNVITGIAYFWDSKEKGTSHYLEDYIGGYGAYSPVDPCTTGVYEPPVFRKAVSGAEDGSKGKHFNPRFLPVAKGFMVQGVRDGKLVFNNRHRHYETNASHHQYTETTHKKHMSGEEPLELSKVQLVVEVNEEYERKLSIAFWEEATPAIDAGMDAEAFEIAATDAGWLQDDRSFVIDVRPQDLIEEIPLFLRVGDTASKIRFSQGNSENTSINKIFILDTQTNVYFSIKEEPLTLELQPGTYHGRFRLAFSEKVPQELLPQVFFEDEAVPVNFEIHQNNLMGELEIIGNDHFPVKAIGIFDLQGKRMLYRTNFDNRRSIAISTSHWANGIYIVKVTGTDNTKTIKKISVYNK